LVTVRVVAWHCQASRKLTSSIPGRKMRGNRVFMLRIERWERARWPVKVAINDEKIVYIMALALGRQSYQLLPHGLLTTMRRPYNGEGLPGRFLPEQGIKNPGTGFDQTRVLRQPFVHQQPKLFTTARLGPGGALLFGVSHRLSGSGAIQHRLW
jgi:hypothetical protein